MSLLISWAAFTAENGLPDLYCRFNFNAWGTPVAVTGKAWHFPDYRDNQGKVGDHPSQFMMRLPACLTSTRPICGCCCRAPTTARPTV
jgi:hypothetical protein